MAEVVVKDLNWFLINRPIQKFGVSIKGLQVFIKRCGGLDALRNLTTTNVCEKFLKPMTKDAKKSYVEMLKEKNDPGVGQSTCFISHAWKYMFLDMVEAMENHTNSLGDRAPEQFFWFDMFTNSQHLENETPPYEWWCSAFKDSIRDIGQVVMVLSPWKNPIPLRRSWCLFEIYCAHETGPDCFKVAFSNRELESFVTEMCQDANSLYDMLSNINLRKSEAFGEAGPKIFDAVENSVGFFALQRKVITTLQIAFSSSFNLPLAIRDLAIKGNNFSKLELSKYIARGRWLTKIGKHAEACNTLERFFLKSLHELNEDCYMDAIDALLEAYTGIEDSTILMRRYDLLHSFWFYCNRTYVHGWFVIYWRSALFNFLLERPNIYKLKIARHLSDLLNCISLIRGNTHEGRITVYHGKGTLTRLLSVATPMLGKGHSFVLSLKKDLAIIEISFKNFSTAEKLLTDRIDVFDKNLQQQRDFVVRCNKITADNYWSKNYLKGVEQFGKITSEYVAIVGDDNHTLAQKQVIESFVQSGDLQKAMEFYESLTRTYDGKLGNDEIKAMLAKSDLAMCLSHAGMHSKSLALLDETTSLLDEMFGADNTLGFDGHHYRAMGLYKTRDYAAAQEEAQKLYSAQEKWLHKRARAKAETHNLLFRILYTSKDYHGAFSKYLPIKFGPKSITTTGRFDSQARSGITDDPSCTFPFCCFDVQSCLTSVHSFYITISCCCIPVHYGLPECVSGYEFLDCAESCAYAISLSLCPIQGGADACYTRDIACCAMFCTGGWLAAAVEHTIYPCCCFYFSWMECRWPSYRFKLQNAVDWNEVVFHGDKVYRSFSWRDQYQYDNRGQVVSYIPPTPLSAEEQLRQQRISESQQRWVESQPGFRPESQSQRDATAHLSRTGPREWVHNSELAPCKWGPSWQLVPLLGTSVFKPEYS